MQKATKIIWGIILIAVGALFALNALGLTTFHLFFDGWWSLFIIIPCTIGLFTERDKTGNLIGIAVGVFLLLCCQNREIRRCHDYDRSHQKGRQTHPFLLLFHFHIFLSSF